MDSGVLILRLLKSLVLQGSLGGVGLVRSVRLQADGLQPFDGLGVQVLNTNEFPCDVVGEHTKLNDIKTHHTFTQTYDMINVPVYTPVLEKSST